MKTPFLGCAYYPEDWDDSQLEYDISMMKKAGITCARIGEFAWRKMEPKRGQYEFGWLHRVVDALGAAGISVVLGTPTATPPVWLGKSFPDVFVLNKDGTRASHGGRRHCCSNNPHYLDASDQIVHAMGREFGSDPNVVGWQLDNEILTWGTGCTCEHCVKAYHDRLRREYGDIETLNARWNLNLFSQAYDDFDEIPGDWNAWHNPHLKYEWAAAHYEADIAFMHRQTEILRLYTKAPIGTDMMPTNAMGYEEMCAPLDVVMFNHYNTPENLSDAVFWFDYLRTLKDRPFWNTETATTWNGSTAIGQVLKPEGYCRVNSWLPVALGGECNMYWLWRQHWAGHELVHGSVLTPEGRPTHTFGEVQRTAEEYEKVSAFIGGTKVKAECAVHFTSKAWQLFDQQKVFNDNWYAGDVQAVHRALRKSGVCPDVIGAAHSLDGYKLLVSPCLMTLEDGDLADKIRTFVENGGVWVAGPLTDVRNDIGAHYVDRAMGMIEDWLGVRQDYGIPTDGSVLKCAWADGDELHVRKWAENYTNLGDGEVLASVTGGHSALIGETVIGRYKVGKGEVILCGALLEEADYMRLFALACEDASVTPYSTDGGLNVIPRAGEAGEGMILCETAHRSASVEFEGSMTDLLTGETFEGRAEVEPYGVRVLKKN